MENQYIIPIFIPYEKDSSNYIIYNKNNSGKKITKEEIKEIIDNYLKEIKNKESKIEIAFLGGNFTSLEQQLQEDILKLINEQYIDNQKIESIRISTTPQYINKQILKLFKKYKVKTIELNVPSTNDYILQKTENKYKFSNVKKATRMIKWNGFKLAFQMAVGLPESTKIDEINTAKSLIKLKPKMIRISQILVIKGTKLEKEYADGLYEPLPLVQAIETSKELVRMFNDKNIEVIEIDIKNDEKDIIAGPYHPEFRQLVESGMWYDAIVGKIKKLNVKVKEVEVTVNPIDSNNVIGYKNENAQKLKDIYDVDLILKQDENIKQGKSKIEITKTYNDFLEDEKQTIKK